MCAATGGLRLQLHHVAPLGLRMVRRDAPYEIAPPAASGRPVGAEDGASRRTLRNCAAAASGCAVGAGDVASRRIYARRKEEAKPMCVQECLIASYLTIAKRNTP